MKSIVSIITHVSVVVDDLCYMPGLTGSQMDLRVNFIRRMREPCLRIYYEQALRKLYDN